MIATDLETLAHPAGRLPGTAGHDAAADYILERFAALRLASYAGFSSYEHTFDAGNGIVGRNLVGVIPGRDRSAAPLLIAAHYDSVIAAPCADDNAAAVAVVLAVAGTIPRGTLNRDVIVVAFDTEEPPRYLTAQMGSARFVADALVRPVDLAVVLDLVGHPVALGGLPLDPHLIFATGAESHPALPAVLEGLDLPIVPTRNDRVGDMSDHGAFRKKGMPFLFFSCGEWPDYHTRGDTVDGVDLRKLERLASALTLLMHQADAADLGPALDHDTTDLEVKMLREHLRALPEIDAIRTRADLDWAIPRLRAAASGGR